MPAPSVAAERGLASPGVATVSAAPGPSRPTDLATHTCPTTPAPRTPTRPSRFFSFSSHPCSFSRLRRPSSSRRRILWSQTTNGLQQAWLLPTPRSRQPLSPSQRPLPLSSRTVRPSPPYPLSPL